MAPDDRERTFDKALARHLRPHAPGEADASHPDAELLAVYHERLLAPEQMISYKGHIAGCSRCQQILAQLEATDELLVEADQEERQAQTVLTMPQPDLAQVSAEAPAPAAPRITVAARVSRLRKATRGANWGWLAPAGALAAGLLLWVSFHETNPPPFQLAKNQPTPAPSSAPATMPQPAAPGKKEYALKEAPASSPHLRAGARTESGAFALGGAAQNEPAQNKRVQGELPALEKKPVAPRQTDKLTAPRRDSSSKVPAGLDDRDTNRATVTVDAAAEETELKKEAPTSVLTPAPPAELKNRDVANMVVLAPSSAKPEAPAKAKTVTSATGRQAPQEQQTSGVVSELRQMSRVVNAGTSVTVTTPNTSVLWRIAAAGIIEHSTDAGATWVVQSSGVVADLLAGSAPSDKICWIVGRAGTILRTTDAGAHWQKIRAPVADDLLAVFAVDAQQASVSLTQSSYQTMDGGRTWHKLLPE